MHLVTLSREDDFDGWRDAARALASAAVAPEKVSWQVEGMAGDLFGTEPLPASENRSFRVPRAFMTLAELVVCHRDPEKFALLYAFLRRVQHEPERQGDLADPLRRRLEAMARTVRREVHKMHAFVRFREVKEVEGELFVAWFEPEHPVVRLASGFFVRRFASLRWSILTPDISLHWDGTLLREGPGAQRSQAPDADPAEEAWKTYYSATFNPARLKIGAMLKEMPRRYWRNMPETETIRRLVAQAPARERTMLKNAPSPGKADRLSRWEALRRQALGCTRCPLHRTASCTVFGEGLVGARIMIVGEQPGDQEDRAGRPFVGPAGQLLDRSLVEAGIDRASVYLTNAVKHFKWEPRGKRRIHASPNAAEVEACRWWYEQERALVSPPITIALGATAARTVFGGRRKVSELRGRPHPVQGGEAWVTVHPSFLLRVQEDREAHRRRFVEDLSRIAERARAIGRPR